MKNFRILKYVLLFAIFSVFSGCVKDDVRPSATIVNKYTLQETLMQNAINAYNNILESDANNSIKEEVTINRDGEDFFAQEFGTQANSRVVYQYDSKEILMMPLEKGGVIENFMMVNESNEIMILNKTEFKSNEDLESIGVSKNLANIFEISNELIDNNIDALSVDNTLGSDLTLTRDGNYLMALEDPNITNDLFL